MKPFIPKDNSEGYFKKVNYSIDDNGNVVGIVDTEIINVVKIGESKLSDLLPILKLIGAEWKLNVAKHRDMLIAKSVMINSVKNN